MIDFSSIKAIGFDLDRTLYSETAEIKQAERKAIYEGIASRLGITSDDAKTRYEEVYAQTQSGGKALVSLGIPDGREFLRDCLVTSNISRFIERDEELVRFFDRLSQDYFTFLITESKEVSGLQKLTALGLIPVHFRQQFFWDTTSLRKDDGSVYREIAHITGFSPQEHVYCGDRLSDDISPAKAIGYHTVLVGSQDSQATICIPTIHSLEAEIYGTR